MESIECDVCFHRYDEDERQPRNLACGHTLCSVCITDGITDSQVKCPFCREAHALVSATDIPVNFALLKVVRAFATGGLDPQQNPNGNAASPVVPMRAFLEPEVHAGICAEHGSYKLFWCLNCQLWICRDCTVVEHPSGTCTVLAIKHALDKIKKDEENYVIQTGKSKNAFVNVLNDYQTKLSEDDKRHDGQLEGFQEVIAQQKEVKCLLQKENKRVASCLKEIHEAFDKMMVAKTVMAEETTVEGITTKRHACQRCRKDLDCLIDLSQEELAKADALKISGALLNTLQATLKVTGYQNQTEASLFLLSSILEKLDNIQDITIDDLRYFMSHTSVWAVTDDNSMGANVTMEDGQIHLHALKRATPPPNAFMIPYSHIRSLAKGPQELFLDLSWEGQKKGRISIKMENESDLTAKFLERCTGEDPNRLRGSKMVQVLEKHSLSCRLCGGGGDDSVTSNIVENLAIQQQYAYEQTNNWVTLCTINETVGFCVWLSNNHEHHNSYVTLGRLTKGMDICNLAANYRDIKKVQISDCGLLIK